MLTINIPTLSDAWLWLARLGYRRYSASQKASGIKPTGIPGNRDPDNPCTGYEPRPKKLGDWGNCDTDGHYMCASCCHRKPPDDQDEGVA